MATKQSKYVPPPTSGHVAVPIGDKLYQWGGRGSKQRRNMVDVFDVKKEQWECLTTRGPPPLGIERCAYTVIGSSLFTFGGMDDDRSYYNSLHQLDTKTMEWRELVPRNPSDAPQKKNSCGMVSFNDDKLVVFAGYTTHHKRTDEIHIFDTQKMTWTPQPTTGTKPPPFATFTFTKIDATMAVVFGGDDGKGLHNDVYILDMRKWEWTLLEVSGGPKPSVRVYHAACCLVGPLTGQEHPLLVVMGGLSYGFTVLDDVWSLDIDGRRWKQVALPEAIGLLPRCDHTTTGFGAGPDCRQLVLCGGRKTFIGGSIGETTLLDFDLTGGEVKVTSVVKEDQLGKPGNRLREKIERLWPQPTQTPTRVAEMIASQEGRREHEESLRKKEEQAKEVREHEESMRRAEQQAKAAEERKENMRRVEALEQAVELLKKTINAPPQLVPPDSTVPQIGDKPKFHHLKLFKGKDGNTIRAIKTVASNWDDLAYSLHFERQVVKTIRRDNPQDSESACEEVLGKWLSGDLTTRQPVTWATLIQSLKDCQQNSLAEDLERALF